MLRGWGAVVEVDWHMGAWIVSRVADSMHSRHCIAYALFSAASSSIVCAGTLISYQSCGRALWTSLARSRSGCWNIELIWCYCSSHSCDESFSIRPSSNFLENSILMCGIVGWRFMVVIHRPCSAAVMVLFDSPSGSIAIWIMTSIFRWFVVIHITPSLVWLFICRLWWSLGADGVVDVQRKFIPRILSPSTSARLPANIRQTNSTTRQKS